MRISNWSTTGKPQGPANTGSFLDKGQSRNTTLHISVRKRSGNSRLCSGQISLLLWNASSARDDTLYLQTVFLKVFSLSLFCYFLAWHSPCWHILSRSWFCPGWIRLQPRSPGYDDSASIAVVLTVLVISRTQALTLVLHHNPSLQNGHAACFYKTAVFFSHVLFSSSSMAQPPNEERQAESAFALLALQRAQEACCCVRG